MTTHIKNNKAPSRNVAYKLQLRGMIADDITKSFPEGSATTPSTHVSTTPAATSSASMAEQSVDVPPLKSDVSRTGTAKRLSRFGQDSHAAAVAANADPTPEQHHADEQRNSSAAVAATAPQPAFRSGLKLLKGGNKVLGRCVTSS